jgi:hypothetical protein
MITVFFSMIKGFNNKHRNQRSIEGFIELILRIFQESKISLVAFFIWFFLFIPSLKLNAQSAKIEPFKKIHAEGRFSLILIPGDREMIASNDLPSIRFSVANSRLNISMDKKVAIDTVIVYVSLLYLEELKVAVKNVSSIDTLRAGYLNLEINSCPAILMVNTDKIAVTTIGTRASVDLYGKTNTSYIYLDSKNQSSITGLKYKTIYYGCTRTPVDYKTVFFDDTETRLFGYGSKPDYSWMGKPYTLKLKESVPVKNQATDITDINELFANPSKGFTEIRNPGEFNSINSGKFRLVLQKGSTPSVKIKTKTILPSFIDVDSTGGVLSLKIKNRRFVNYFIESYPEILITYKNIDSIVTTGCVSGEIVNDKFYLDIDNIYWFPETAYIKSKINVIANDLSVNLGIFTDLQLTGRSDNSYIYFETPFTRIRTSDFITENIYVGPDDDQTFRNGYFHDVSKFPDLTDYIKFQAKVRGPLKKPKHFNNEEAKPDNVNPEKREQISNVDNQFAEKGNENESMLSEGEAPHYYALIIGISQYRYASPGLMNLQRPEIDAMELQKLLIGKYTFAAGNTKLLKNPTRDDIIAALEDLAKSISPKDNLMIFYAGHGVWDERLKVGYWLPSDAKSDNKSNWIANSTIRDYVSGINSKHTLLIADACFGGSIFRTRDVESSINDYGISKIYSLPSRKAMTSGTLTTVPDQSKFMEFLMKRLNENNDKYLASRQLFFRLEAAVINNSPTVPQFGTIQDTGDEGGDFIFIRK